MALWNLRSSKRGGSYIPVAANVTNVTTIAYQNALFSVDGPLVQVWGAYLIDADAAGVTEFSVTLPFGKDIEAVFDVVGVTSFSGPSADVTGSTIQGRVFGSIADNLAIISGTSGTVVAPGAVNVTYHFAYLIE